MTYTDPFIITDFMRWAIRANDIKAGETILASTRKPFVFDDGRVEFVDTTQAGTVTAILGADQKLEEDRDLVVLQVDTGDDPTRVWRFDPLAWVELADLAR